MARLRRLPRARPEAAAPGATRSPTKLARRVKPYFLLQLCFYSELLAAEQGTVPEWVHVVLGTHARESFRLSEFAAYYRSVKGRLERFLSAGPNGTPLRDPA